MIKIPGCTVTSIDRDDLLLDRAEFACLMIRSKWVSVPVPECIAVVSRSSTFKRSKRYQKTRTENKVSILVISNRTPVSSEKFMKSRCLVNNGIKNKRTSPCFIFYMNSVVWCYSHLDVSDPSVLSALMYFLTVTTGSTCRLDDLCEANGQARSFSVAVSVSYDNERKRWRNCF